MYGAAKGKGKGKGGKEGKGKKGSGHMLPKTRLSVEKFTGTVADWKGKFGWIQPSEEIEHEKASLNGGKLFCGVNDLEGVEALEAGQTVEFHINEDAKGLGAEEIVVIGGGRGKGKGKAAAPAGGAAKGAAKGAWGGKAAPAAAAGYGAKGAAKGWSLGSGKPVYSAYEAPAKGKAAGKMGGGFAKGADKGKGKGKKTPGHLLPRNRISVEKFSGTVFAWKGKYGWIVPSDAIDHEKASKNNGRLFVGKEDLEGGLEELTPESVVEFHIWEDSSGLGADEVVVTG